MGDCEDQGLAALNAESYESLQNQWEEKMIPIDSFEKNLNQYGRVPSLKDQREAYAWSLSRRAFLGHAMRLAAAAALIQLPAELIDRGWLETARAAEPDLIHETLNGLVAFIVPGSDPYSVTQGVSTEEPGGVDANITDALIVTLNLAQPQTVPLPPLSVAAAVVLNNAAQAVNPNPAGGSFSSPFTNLLFQQKVTVLGYLEADPALAPLASFMAFAVAFLAYSEAGVFDSQTRKLTGWPVGWTISGYQGVSRGHDEFKGYFQNRRKVLGDLQAGDGSAGGEENA